jgi:hypothetical protein
MKATPQRSSRTGGTTVGSAEIRYPGLSSIETLSHTLAADDDSHAVMPHLSRKRQKGLGKPRAC